MAVGNNLNNTLIATLANESLFGLGGNDLLIGNATNNYIDGGTGRDTMRGGAGNDTYIVDSIFDIVTELPGQGIDEVRSFISYTLPANVENLILLGTANINGTGNALNNRITGNIGNNILSGLDGNDILIGGAGNDALNGGNGNDYMDGGTGNDNMNGGFGNDTYIVDSVGDVAAEVAGGIDLVIASVSHTLSANMENLTLSGVANINGTGNARDNVINGNGGNNFLFGLAGNDTLNGGNGNDYMDGGTGNDTMNGGFGNDTYIVDSVGDVAAEVAGGIDLVIASVSHTLSTNLENLNLAGAANINGTGNALNNVINGNNGNNFLFGLAGNDTLNGGNGNDYLHGGTGNDTMNGGLGNDTYIVDSVGDVAAEVAGGIDLVIASVSHTLSVNLENLTLTGVANLNGVGNARANVINGNSGNNFLNGLGGNDTLVGGGGSDTLLGGDGSDRLRGGTTAFNAGERDVMIGGTGADTFELGNSAGSYYLNNVGDSFASITDFSAFQLDKFQVKGALSDYRLDKTQNREGGAAADTLIFRGNDLIAVVRDTTNVFVGRDFVAV
ncbi:MAG: hypothetical protein Fur0046_11680 [Cyanobacteria bacterium J069]